LSANKLSAAADALYLEAGKLADMGEQRKASRLLELREGVLQIVTELRAEVVK
jgi:hypothetical protein